MCEISDWCTRLPKKNQSFYMEKKANSTHSSHHICHIVTPVTFVTFIYSHITSITSTSVKVIFAGD